MIRIQILGTGCPKCTTLFEHTETAVSELGIECELEKVTDINEIVSFGVMATPAIVVDGEVKAAGKLVSVDEVKKLLS